MDDALDLITSRRTTKLFLPKVLSWEVVSRLIDAARHAPSCGNLQNWKFIIVLDPGVKQHLAEAAFDQYEIAQAAVIIVICAEPEKAKRYYGVRGERLYTIQNCAAAAQNILLEAHSLGLGTRWIGAFDEENVREIVGAPEEVRPQIMIAVGYSKETPQKLPKYPLESLIYFNRWRSKIRDPAKYMNDIATILARRVSNAGETLQNLAKKMSSAIKKEDNK